MFGYLTMVKALGRLLDLKKKVLVILRKYYRMVHARSDRVVVTCVASGVISLPFFLGN